MALSNGTAKMTIVLADTTEILTFRSTYIRAHRRCCRKQAPRTVWMRRPPQPLNTSSLPSSSDEPTLGQGYDYTTDRLRPLKPEGVGVVTAIAGSTNVHDAASSEIRVKLVRTMGEMLSTFQANATGKATVCTQVLCVSLFQCVVSLQYV